MTDSNIFEKVSMHVTRGCLVVLINFELVDQAIIEIQKRILERVHSSEVKGIILDLSELEIADSFLGNAIKNIARTAALLGTTTVVTGLKPGVVASLVELEIEFENIQTVLKLEDGFQILTNLMKITDRELDEENKYEE